MKPDAILPPEPESDSLPAPVGGTGAAAVPARRARRRVSLVRRELKPRDLYGALLADARCENTRLARAFDMKALARFLDPSGKLTPAQACAALIKEHRPRTATAPGRCNALALAFRAHLVGRGLAPSSVNRPLTTVRKAVVLARRLGMITWSMDVELFRVTPFRDVRGPGDDGWRKLWAAAVARGDGPVARRDRAIIRLLNDLALRKSEALGVDYPTDVDLAGMRLQIKGKGKQDREWLTLPRETAAALRAWVEARGDFPGPLFVALSQRYRYTNHPLRNPKRPVERELNRILRALSAEAGLERWAKPHGLRHRSISRALTLLNGNVVKAQKFARHVSPTNTLRYLDAVEDMAGEVARLVAGDTPD